MNLKILIVDDEIEIRRFLESHLSPPNTVMTASCGATAITLFTQLNFDVILTDIRMPGIDGFGLMHTVKILNPHCEVILMSGDTDYEEVINALNEEAFAFLKKPLHLEVLARRFHQVAHIVKAKQENNSNN